MTLYPFDNFKNTVLGELEAKYETGKELIACLDELTDEIASETYYCDLNPHLDENSCIKIGINWGYFKITVGNWTFYFECVKEDDKWKYYVTDNDLHFFNEKTTTFIGNRLETIKEIAIAIKTGLV